MGFYGAFFSSGFLGRKPMFIHSVEYAGNSKYDVDTVVSSESSV